MGIWEKFVSAISHYDQLAEKTRQIEMDPLDREDIQNSIRNIKEEIDKLPQYYSDLIQLFTGVKNKKDLSAYEDNLYKKEAREDFYKKVSRFGNSLHQALSSADFITETSQAKIDKYKKELSFFCKLKKYIQEVYAESIDYKDYEPKIENLLNHYVQSEDVTTVVPLISIYDKKFNTMLKGKSPKSQALMILHNTKKYISDNMEKDKTFFERLSKLLQETLDNYQKKRISETEFLKKAVQLKDEVLTRTGDQTPSSLEGNELAKAFFGILRKTLDPNLNKKSMEKLADMSLQFCQIIEKHRVVDWFKNRDIQNKIKNDIDDYLYEKKKDFSIGFDSIDRIMEETIKTAKIHSL